MFVCVCLIRYAMIESTRYFFTHVTFKFGSYHFDTKFFDSSYIYVYECICMCIYMCVCLHIYLYGTFIYAHKHIYM